LPSSNFDADTGASPSKRGWRATFDALSVRNYRFFWMGTLSSFFAGQMQLPTQMWLAYEITGSPLLLGLTSAFQGIPQLIIAPFGGFIIDRFQKRTLIMATQSITVLINLAIAILITLGAIQYWHLLVSSFLSGAANAFNFPARNSIVAELVPRDKMYNAYTLNNGASNIARVAGPALAGVLIGLVGTQGAYYVGVGFNILAIVTISMLPPTSKLGLIGKKSALANFTEGFAYLKLNNVILMLLGLEVGLTIFGMSFQGLIPVFADLLNAGSEKYGLMMSFVGIGSLIGVLGIASQGNFKRKGFVMLVSGIVFGTFLVLFGNTVHIQLDETAYYAALFTLLVVGMSAIAYSATSLTIIQLGTSDEYRGRVTSTYQIVIALYPFSMLLAGAVAQAIGAPLALTINGSCLAFLMLVMIVFNKRVRSLE
jgi:MFS family permease